MNKNKIFLILIIAVVFLMGIYKLNYYPQLSQGDHGRDLYSAQAALRGELPYKDYWWVYGPIMPYYFAVFYKIAGSSIIGFLLGDLVLKTAAAAFFYLACAQFIPAFVAFIGAIWFAQSQPDFFFTFNHAAGITTELFILFCLFAFIKNRTQKYLWMCLPAILIYCCIKINFGLAAFVVVLLTAACCKFKNRRFYIASALTIGLVALIYGLLLQGMSIEEIRQCHPYFGDDQPHHFPPSMTIPYYFMQHWLTFVHGPINMIMGLILHSATLIVIVRVLLKKIEPKDQQLLFSTLGLLAVFFIINFHEFVVSGVWYRTYWSLPFLFVFHFLMMWQAFRIFPALVRGVIWAAFGSLFILNILAGFFTTQSQKIPPRLLTSVHGQIYLGNEMEWTQTVNTVTDYLNKNLKKDETFFALPYDDIYYYLTNKKSPSRMLIFFDHIKILPAQEVAIIKELEQNNVAYVLMSNRIASSERGLGIFGKTYCPLIAAYINQKFTPVARQGGDWQKEPGWGNNHGVLILKRK